jgi:hypothetical protein
MAGICSAKQDAIVAEQTLKSAEMVTPESRKGQVRKLERLTIINGV